jgi:membrane-bound serine protease (ClpP class)
LAACSILVFAKGLLGLYNILSDKLILGVVVLRVVRLLLMVGLLAAALLSTEVQAAADTVDVLHVEGGTVNPVLVDYIERGIEHAEDSRAAACIIQLDTPGGLDTSMREIIEDIVNARVPVVVYVSPAGSRAASAGVFITVAAHVAAMAPSTAIGAAHPVSIGQEGEAQISETMEEKVVNDAAALIRGLAVTHGRNVEWAESAVRESVSATEQEALDLNVVDLVAANLDDLLVKLDGREVTLLGGAVVTLETADVAINHIYMNNVEGFLYAISDPNIAYLLLSLAMLGIMAEISNPGLIFPGVLGAIALLLAFFSLGMLPVNYAGVLLIVLAFGLFIAEVFTTSFGLLTAGGITSLVLGSLILFKGGPLFQVNPWLIASLTVVIAGLVILIIYRVISVHRKQAYTGREELLGKTALVKTPLDPEGIVLFKGERWSAASEQGRIEPGETVTIDKVESLKLHVAKR